jgi:predicted enzyme related to lactoylglutathione lyase
MSNATGRFVWYDLMTTDVEGAKKFYSKVAGWGTQPFEGSTPYTMWTNKGAPIGGVSPLTDEMKKGGVPPHWLPAVAVDNVDETVKKTNSLGGKTIVPPMDIPGTGRYAVIQDPQDVVIAVFAGQGEMAGAPGGSDFDPKKGEFSWHELTTSDQDAAWKFYSNLFGWEKQQEMDMGPMGKYLMYGQRGKMYGGMMTRQPDMPRSNWLCYFVVDDAKASAKTIADAGGKVMMGPMEVPGGDWVTIATDPQGAAFGVHSKATGK